MKNVLIISYHFPPSSSTGAIRPLKFVKYLGDYGWEAVVLTCKNPFDFGSGVDHNLLLEIPSATKVYRTGTFEPLNCFWRWRHRSNVRDSSASPSARPQNDREWAVKKSPDGPVQGKGIISPIKNLFLDILRIPDREQGWIPFAFLKGLVLIRQRNIRVIFATSPVPSALVVGFLLSKATGRLLILDYRDPWTSAPWAGRHYRFFEKINSRIEYFMVKHASYVISMTKTRAEELSLLYPWISPDKFVVIPNGFDRQDAASGTVEAFKEFTFIHAGSIYSHLEVDNFLKALKAVVDEDESLRNRISAVFIGTKPSAAVFDQLEKIGTTRFLDRIPRKDCMQFIARSHIGLVFLKNDQFNKGCIASKVFDYMLLKRPVLGVINEGETADLIQRTRIGVQVNPDNIAGIKAAIMNLYNAYKNNRLSEYYQDESMLSKYDRKKLTGDLVSLMSKVLDSSATPAARPQNDLGKVFIRWF